LAVAVAVALAVAVAVAVFTRAAKTEQSASTALSGARGGHAATVPAATVATADV
jgi:hypothetical protein